MTAYYNDVNEDAAAVLTTLIEDGVIAPGDVDTRSIKDVQPDDLRGYTQCHFFAGGGLWSVAARLAGWPDDRPLWTGSCPCQPFSQAGRRAGTDDPRHLWPDFYRLISARRPTVVMGEQVAGKAGRDWFDGVRTDLAVSGWGSRPVDIPACAIDSPQQRNRLYWIAVADSASQGRDAAAQDRVHLGKEGGRPWDGEPQRLHGANGQVADLHRGGRDWRAETPQWPAFERVAAERPALRNGSWWADGEWIECHDGKLRRSKPGLPLLVDGLSGRVGLWSIAGNAISPVLAAEVIASFIDVYGLPERIAA
jgi:DNA (cytosine-5)-methyltransferase 1